jgi:hypothetical protein
VPVMLVEALTPSRSPASSGVAGILLGQHPAHSGWVHLAVNLVIRSPLSRLPLLRREGCHELIPRTESLHGIVGVLCQ